MNNTLNKKTPMDILKHFVSDNKVILMFIVLSIICILISGANVSYVAGEVFSRFGRNTCLVLALIIPCMAGLGMNFGIVVGAIAAQISIFWIVHWGFVGVPGFLLCVAMSTPLALLFDWLTGMLFNKTKGSEMVAGLVLGFFAAGLYRLFTLYIMGGVIPYDDPNLLDRGFGLRNAFDLTGNLNRGIYRRAAGSSDAFCRKCRFLSAGDRGFHNRNAAPLGKLSYGGGRTVPAAGTSRIPGRGQGTACAGFH